ncbi:hypothetical protein BpHYR1_026829 [Brachionus plicatilis]|uniref:Uncharacterized protein n=1 Tax=Brachionus plicatilis TaxID=10195 RepID=A0A3M7QBX1_BRAPC|nr:hypothetical protein BpHYR1_026829 [Brachionus plicatilis]
MALINIKKFLKNKNELVNYWKIDSKLKNQRDKPLSFNHSLNSFHILHTNIGNGVFFLQGLELLTKALTYSLINSIVIYLNELQCYQALCHQRNLSGDPMEYHEENYNCT